MNDMIRAIDRGYPGEELVSLSTGELADYMRKQVDMDPECRRASTRSVLAEIERRGLTGAQLDEAWDQLDREQSARGCWYVRAQAEPEKPGGSGAVVSR